MVRHKELGLFQGIIGYRVVFYPFSNFCDIGIFQFDSFIEANALVDLLCSKECTYKMDVSDFLIEEFDESLDARIKSSSAFMGPWTALYAKK